MKKSITISFAILWALWGWGVLRAQGDFNYALSLVPVSVTNLQGLHSYAFAQHQGKWLIIGGRKDGIHARQPFNAFPASQNNTNIYVVDVPGNQFWSASVNSLPSGLREQLQSTNMNFYQDADTLYIVGGYGFSSAVNNHITHPYLTSVGVSALISAVQAGLPIQPHFKQIQDNLFAVTGGSLKKLNGLFYLVGGHRFDGRYNPIGQPTFTQSYTQQIRKFSINNSGGQLSYSNYTALTDPIHLRRRDYNLLPQIFPNGEFGLTISSGVFQSNADLPFLYPVDITSSGYTPVTTFNQYLSNYHCPIVCLYDSVQNNMHSIFSGGMSQYYFQGGSLVQDNSVPFVRTISRVTRDASGSLTEYRMPIEMPSLQGAGGEFIPNLSLPHYPNKVFKMGALGAGPVLLGHIFGGINSPQQNPFSSNQTSVTSASSLIYEVWLTANPSSVNELALDGKNPRDFALFPNPFDNSFSAVFTVASPVEISYLVSNGAGQIIQSCPNTRYDSGEHKLSFELSDFFSAGQYYLTLVFDNRYYVTKKVTKK